MDNPHANGGAPFIQTACETLYSILDSSLKVKTVSELIQASSGQEQALCVLLAATGMRVSEARAVIVASEIRHRLFTYHRYLEILNRGTELPKLLAEKLSAYSEIREHLYSS